MEVSRFKLGSPIRHVVCGVALAAVVGGAATLVLKTFSHTLARNADTIYAAEFAATASSGDPFTRFRYAAFLERTFDLNVIPRVLGEYEAAVALTPHNFIFWLALGQARERAGERLAAEAAYRRALELAPNYARTKWALGNNLIRQGRTDEGMELVRGAVEQDPTFAMPAVNAAMLALDGNVEQVSSALGASPTAAAELAKYLVNEGRFEEGVSVWERIPHSDMGDKLSEAGKALRAKLIAAGRYRDAVKVTASMEPDEQKRPIIGTITNGGFESGVESQNADVFDWRVGQPYPVYGLSDSQPNEGKYSLLVRFPTASRLDLTTISRTIAVEPGAEYELSFAYRAELNTRAEFRWEVVSANEKAKTQLGVSDTLSNSTGWTRVAFKFTVPAETEGITFRLTRENCKSGACTVSGNLWFDDFILRRS